MNHPGRAMMMGKVLRTLPSYLERRLGADAARLVEASGLDPDELAQPEGVLPVWRVEALFSEAIARTGDPALMLDFAAGVPLRDLGLHAYVMLNCETVGACLRRYHRLAIQHRTGGLFAFEVGERQAVFTVESGDPGGTRCPQVGLGSLVIVTRICRLGTGRDDWRPRAVHLGLSEPPVPLRFERFFQAPVHFGRAASALVLDTAALGERFRDADRDLLPVVERHVEAWLARLPESDELVGEVRRRIVAALSSGKVDVAGVAARMDMSARTLQRLLHEQRLSFKEMVAEARLALACRYLADGKMSLTDTAQALGYSDLSAFSRAFRRWSGETASAFRRRSAGSSAAV